MSEQDKNYGAMAMGLQLVGFIGAGVILGQIIEYFVGPGKGIITLICIVLAFVAFVSRLLRILKK